MGRIESKSQIDLYGGHNANIPLTRRGAIPESFVFSDYAEDDGCPDDLSPFTVYNIFQYKSNEKVQNQNDLINNGIGPYVTAWSAFHTFLIGRVVTFKGNTYNVIINTAAGESPETNPEKYALTTYPGVGMPLGLITNYMTIGRTLFNIGSTINPFIENYFSLNNQNETDQFDNLLPVKNQLQNLGEVDIYRNPSDGPVQVKLHDDVGNDVLMEYIILHFKPDPCQEGWLYLEIDEPKITGATEDGHLLYFMVNSGNPNVDELGDPIGVTIGSQYLQNTATVKPFSGALEDLRVILGDNNSFDNSIVLRSVVPLKDIGSENTGKKIVVGLNTPIFAEAEQYYTIIIGLRAWDFKATKKYATTTNDAPGPSTTKINYFDYTNPDVGRPVLTFTNIRVFLDPNVNNRWDDEPLPSFSPGMMPQGVGKSRNLPTKYYNTSIYTLHFLDSNNDIAFGFDRVKTGLPNFSEYASSGGVNHAPDISGTPITFGSKSNTGLRLGEFSLHNSGMVGTTRQSGNILQVGAYDKEWFGTSQTWKMRLPRCIGAGKTGSVWTLITEGIDEGSYKHTSFASIDTKIGLYRFDDFIVNPPEGSYGFGIEQEALNGLVNIRQMREEAVLIQEWIDSDFYSDIKSPINDASEFNTNPLFATQVVARYSPSTVADMFNDVDLDPTIGDVTGKDIAKYFLIIGSKSEGTGFFAITDTPRPPSFEENLSAFPAYGITYIFDSGGFESSGNPSIPNNLDPGQMIWQEPRIVNLTDDPGPRDYGYVSNPNINPFTGLQEEPS